MDTSDETSAFRKVLNEVERIGRTGRQLDQPFLTDVELWDQARRMDAGIFPRSLEGIDRLDDHELLLLDQLREWYEQGRRPLTVDVDLVARAVRALGVPAGIIYDCGNIYLLHVGPEFTDDEGVERKAVTCGPVYEVGGNFESEVHDFTFGPGDSTVEDGPCGELDEGKPLTAREIAQLIVEVLDAELARRGYDAKAVRAHEDEVKKRTESAVEQGAVAFWEVVSRHFPEITTGDMDPGAVLGLEQDLTRAVTSWVGGNQPEGTWAGPLERAGIKVTPAARYASQLRNSDQELGGWGSDIWAMRQRVGLVIAVPINGDPDSEVYATSEQDAVDILMSWKLADLRDAVRGRGLDVPKGKRGKRGLVEALVAAGPAHFNEGGDRY